MEVNLLEFVHIVVEKNLLVSLVTEIWEMGKLEINHGVKNVDKKKLA